jgi:hypothetical protein
VVDELHPEAAGELRARLDDIGYRLSDIETLLGADAMAALRDHDPDPALWATQEPSPLGTAIRLFHIGVPVETAQARRALGDLEAWAQVGLLVVHGDETRAALQLRCHAADPETGWLIASDLLVESPRPDLVMGVGAASHTLAHMTVRRPVTAALDLGTGGGIQSLYAARHAAVVRATDRNPRALRIAALNFALNGVDGVELREGDLFEPAADRRYGLIVSNPPFVISPESSLMFRDGTMQGDALCRRLVREAPSYLEAGGFCQLLANWAVGPEETWTERIEAWFAESPCDVWVLQRDVQEPSEYTRIWLRQGGGTPAPGSYDAWMRWYDEQGIAGIGFGVVSMRLPEHAGPPHRLMQEIRHEIEAPAGAFVEAQFAAMDVAWRSSDEALMRAHLRTSDGVVLEQVSRLSGDAWTPTSLRVREERGLRWTGDVQPPVATLLAGCDGTRPLVDALAGVGVSTTDLPGALATVRQLLIEGFLVP